MTLTQMRYFYAVCQWQNITKAAEHLHVSQPTVSVAMQAMETETGLNLFHREGRKLLLTHDGSKLLGKISHILDQVEQLEAEISDLSHNRNHIRMAPRGASGDRARDHRDGRHQRAAHGRG